MGTPSFGSISLPGGRELPARSVYSDKLLKLSALHSRQLDSKRSNRGWAGLSEVGRKLKPERWWAGLEQAVEEARVPRQRKQRAGKKKGKAASKRKPKAEGARSGAKSQSKKAAAQ